MFSFLQPGVLVLISHLAPALPPASFSHQCCVLVDLKNGLDYVSQAALLALINVSWGLSSCCSAPAFPQQNLPWPSTAFLKIML